MVIVLFAFIFTCLFSSCSSDSDAIEEEKEKTSLVNYQATFTSHEWEIISAQERLGDFWIDIKDADAYCRFTADSVYFTEGAWNYHFEGSQVKGSYEITPRGNYPYTIEESNIKIDNQTFMITSQDSDLVLRNEDWRLVLKNK